MRVIFKSLTKVVFDKKRQKKTYTKQDKKDPHKKLLINKIRQKQNLSCFVYVFFCLVLCMSFLSCFLIFWIFCVWGVFSFCFSSSSSLGHHQGFGVGCYVSVPGSVGAKD